MGYVLQVWPWIHIQELRSRRVRESSPFVDASGSARLLTVERKDSSLRHSRWRSGQFSYVAGCERKTGQMITAQASRSRRNPKTPGSQTNGFRVRPTEAGKGSPQAKGGAALMERLREGTARGFLESWG